MKQMGFTFSDYRETLAGYIDAGYSVTGFDAYLSKPSQKHMILRHDCDNSLRQAMRIAKIDYEMGVSSTFFVRMHATGYNIMTVESIDYLHEMRALGHEVELHLEAGLEGILRKSKLESFDFQFETFKSLIDWNLQGFSSHEPSRMGSDSMADDLVDRWHLSYHAYDARFQMPQMKYISDSSARWREGHFYEWIGKADLIQVLVHPIWWYQNIPQENY